jgi:hypothetical protein
LLSEEAQRDPQSLPRQRHHGDDPKEEERSESWYALVKDLRQRARKDGKPDPRLAKGAPEE